MAADNDLDPRILELQRYSLEDVQIDLNKDPFGSGFRSSVFEGTYLGLKCAGKKLHRHVLLAGSDDSIVERFLEECSLLSRVRHPNIVQFLGVSFKPTVRAPILVMEFLPTDLNFCIEKYGILPEEISYSIFYDVAVGLYYLHHQNMVHRNLNSKKILLTSNMTAKISDLGIAKIISGACKKWSIRPGDPSFVAPEANNVSNPSYGAYTDIFSFGIIMIHALCGKVPIPEDSMTVDEAQRRKSYLEHETIRNDHQMEHLIRKCIRNDQTKRPKAQEIVDMLESRVCTPDTFEKHLDMLKGVIKMKSKPTSSAHKQLSEESQPSSATGGHYTRNGPETITRTGGQSILSSPQDGESEEPDTSQPDGNSGTNPAAEQKPTADHSWCSVIKRPSTKPGVIPIVGIQGASGVAVMEALWGPKVLGVRFNQGKKNLLSKWKLENGNQMTTEIIIYWANTWNTLCGPSVPRFVDVDAYPDLPGVNANIRVDFTDDGVNWSKIGTEATHCSDDFTMQISLVKATNDSLKKHYIIHEFGHALGLGHEHQRSKFWRVLYPFVYIEKMMNDPDIGGFPKFGRDWNWISEHYYTSDLIPEKESDGYDPKSIMHYWFKVEWLNRIPAGGKDYSVRSNIVQDKQDLSPEAFSVLEGLHERGLHLPSAPSKQDITFLKKCYDDKTK